MDNFFEDIMLCLNSSISSVADIFSRFMSGRWLTLFLTVFLVITVWRTIIMPIIGVSGSDGVLNQSQKKESNNE